MTGPVRPSLGIAAVLALAASATAQLPVNTTLQDFFLPGTQPSTITDGIQHSSVCSGCHGGFSEEHAPFDTWRASMMSQSARDPLFHACTTIANQDAVGAADLCIRCHTPGGWLEGRSVPTDLSALVPNDFDGVTCNVCHRMVDPVYSPGVSPAVDGTPDPGNGGYVILDPSNLGGSVPTEPHTGTMVIDPLDRRRGPFDLGAFPFHAWLESPFHQESLLCSTCHDVSNPAFTRSNTGSTPVPSDTYSLNTLNTAHPTQSKYDMFPLERTFSEWSQSDFATAPVDMGGRFGGAITSVSTCQDCHMPDTEGTGCNPAFNPPLRPDMPRHTLAGAGNWQLQSILNLDASHALYPVGAESNLTQDMVDAAIARNESMLQRAASMDLSDNGIDLTVRVTNETGHKLPTGYPEGRRMWLNVVFRDSGGSVITEHGAYDSVSAVLTTIDTKVYEAKLGLDAAQAAATGLPVGESFHFVLNNTYIKDNRIPPRGFTNANFEAIQAHPVAYSYADGEYWDETTFAIPGAAVSADVTLYYQSTSKEYIEFLRDENTTDTKGQIAYDEWVAEGKSAPIAMVNQVRVLGDPVVAGCEGSGSFTGNTDCPCSPVNNSAPGSLTGCKNSSGLGARLTGAPGCGTSLSADATAGGGVSDGIQLQITQMVPASASIVLVFNSPASPPFTPGILVGPPYDGVLCVGGGPRTNPFVHAESRVTGVGVGINASEPTVTQDANIQAPGFFTAGGDAHFQCWYRDNFAASIGCVGNANFSNSGTIINLAP